MNRISLLLCFFCHHFIKGKVTQSRFYIQMYSIIYTLRGVFSRNQCWLLLCSGWFEAFKKLNFTCVIKWRTRHKAVKNNIWQGVLGTMVWTSTFQRIFGQEVSHWFWLIQPHLALVFEPSQVELSPKPIELLFWQPFGQLRFI